MKKQAVKHMKKDEEVKEWWNLPAAGVGGSAESTHQLAQLNLQREAHIPLQLRICAGETKFSNDSSFSTNFLAQRAVRKQLFIVSLSALWWVCFGLLKKHSISTIKQPISQRMKVIAHNKTDVNVCGHTCLGMLAFSVGRFETYAFLNHNWNSHGGAIQTFGNMPVMKHHK